MVDDFDEKIYTVQELAATGRLRISATTIWREIKDGNLAVYKIRGQVFIAERHIREYLGQCETRRTDRSNIIGNSFFNFAMR